MNPSEQNEIPVQTGQENVAEAQPTASVAPPAPPASVQTGQAQPEPTKEPDGPGDPPPSYPYPAISRGYTPIEIRRDRQVTILVGERQKPPKPGEFQHPVRPQNRSGLVKHHDNIVSLFTRMSIPTDGSMVMLVPGSNLPISLWDGPYEYVKDGATVYVVPNNPSQVGPDAAPAPL